MTSRYTFGKPFNTESVVNFPSDGKIFTDRKDLFPYGKIEITEGFEFSYKLKDSDQIFGLGQTVSGINKRGKVYEGWCTDDPFHTEEKK